MIDFIKIAPNSSVPKYKQIINSIYDALESKALKKTRRFLQSMKFATSTTCQEIQ